MKPPLTAAACVGLVALGMSVPAAPAAGQQQDAMQASVRARIDSLVAPYVAAGDFMGVVAVQRDGAPALVLPYGMASVELGVPHEADGVFLIGSVSKHFTAVAVLLLEEEGLLALEDRVAGHLPDFAHGEAVTIEQLLTHTSGITDIFSLARFRETGGRTGTFAQLIEDLGRAPLTFAPGTGYAYSNGGYAVAAALVERVSGMPFGAFLRTRLFEPLGMDDTAHDAPGPAIPGRVPGYDPWGRTGLSPATPLGPSFSTGSGSLWSTAADLLTWNAALHGGRFLSQAAYAKLTRDYGNGYGLGLSVFTRFDRPVIGHDGRLSGYATDIARYVEDQLTVVILGNVQSVARDDIRRAVAAAALDLPYAAPGGAALAEDATEPLDPLAGVYQFGPGFTVTVSVDGGRLLARANEGADSELVPTLEGAWFSRVLYATVRFGRDASGAVDRLIWGPGEGAPVGRRLTGAGRSP